MSCTNERLMKTEHHKISLREPPYKNEFVFNEKEIIFTTPV